MGLAGAPGVVRLWAASGLARDEPAPLVVVHDGPDYARRGRLLRFLATGVTAGRLPPLRAALLAAPDRDNWYSANDAYAVALTAALPGLAPATRRIGLGASLGALAMLHAQRRYPQAFDALLLQSGSYFQPRFDEHESCFAHWNRIIGFVAEVLTARRAPRPVPVAMTCGADEENLANNRDMAAALAAQGHPVTFAEVPGRHDHDSWRPALRPQLTGLLAGW